MNDNSSTHKACQQCSKTLDINFTGAICSHCVENPCSTNTNSEDSSDRSSSASVQQVSSLPMLRISTSSNIRFQRESAELVRESASSCPVTPLTPDRSGLSPVTSFSELRLRTSKYSWDQSVLDPVLPVRCKNTSGELHKHKFGSGNRGKCIHAEGQWFTPSEFELHCGRGNSKDWKRSIRYGGRAIQCLMKDGVIQPHATSCTCAACCDDISVTGPVRLFVPYRRRKRDGESVDESTPSKRTSTDTASPPIHHLQESGNSGLVILTPTPNTPTTLTIDPLSSTDAIQVVTADGTVFGTASSTPGTPLMLTALNPTLKSLSTPLVAPEKKSAVVNFVEEKQWWHLEELVDNLISYGQQVKNLIEQIKGQSKAWKESTVNELKEQFEKEKEEALNAARIEAHMTLQQVLYEDQDKETNKDDVKLCANCNREALCECTGCRNVSYCSSFCQQKDWANHHQECSTENVVFLREIEISQKQT